MPFQRIPSFPFYIFLIPVFYVWQKLNDYFGLIPLGKALPPAGKYFIITIALFAICWLITQSIRKAALPAAFALLVYLLWGSFHDWLKENITEGFFSSYKFLVSFLAVIFLFILFYQRRKNKEPIRASRFMNLLFFVFIIIEAGRSIFYIIGNAETKHQIYAGMEKEFDNPSIPMSDSLPDIFLIVFDEYASSRSLKKYLNYDNSAFDSFLVSKGFYLVPESSSNYNSTPHSLGSMLDMNYFPRDMEGVPADSPTLLEGQLAFEESYLPGWLEQNGYEIINLGVMDLKAAKSQHIPFFDRDYYQVFDSQTLINRAGGEIFWHFPSWFTSLFRTTNQESIEDLVKKVEVNVNGLTEQLTKTSERPRFIYFHAMIPHSPFLFDAKGNILDNYFVPPGARRDSLYIGQIEYVQSISHQLFSNFATQRRPRIICFLGDHGYRDNHLDYEERIREKQFSNYLAVYFSDQDYAGIYDSMSLVNLFRVISNKYFASQFPLLSDSTIMLK